MELIQGGEWLIIGIFGTGVLISAYLIASVQSDLNLQESSKSNTHEEAVELIIELLKKTKRKIDIHDDGNDFEGSVFNNSRVMDTLQERIRERNIKVRCLFNVSEKTKLRELAESMSAKNRIEIWNLRGERPKPDIHYKIIDGGRMVHLSNHAYNASERAYTLREVKGMFKYHTCRRISKQYRERFDRDLKNADRVA